MARKIAATVLLSALALSTVACAPQKSRMSYNEARLVYAEIYKDVEAGRLNRAPFNKTVK